MRYIDDTPGSGRKKSVLEGSFEGCGSGDINEVLGLELMSREVESTKAENKPKDMSLV